MIWNIVILFLKRKSQNTIISTNQHMQTHTGTSHSKNGSMWKQNFIQLTVSQQPFLRPALLVFPLSSSHWHPKTGGRWKRNLCPQGQRDALAQSLSQGEVQGSSASGRGYENVVNRHIKAHVVPRLVKMPVGYLLVCLESALTNSWVRTARILT